eukprot:m51a1_g819 hypothetical protein (570) ;mRNA; r:697251-699134
MAANKVSVLLRNRDFLEIVSALRRAYRDPRTRWELINDVLTSWGVNTCGLSFLKNAVHNAGPILEVDPDVVLGPEYLQATLRGLGLSASTRWQRPHKRTRADSEGGETAVREDRAREEKEREKEKEKEEEEEPVGRRAVNLLARCRRTLVELDVKIGDRLAREIDAVLADARRAGCRDLDVGAPAAREPREPREPRDAPASPAPAALEAAAPSRVAHEAPPAAAAAAPSAASAAAAASASAAGGSTAAAVAAQEQAGADISARIQGLEAALALASKAGVHVPAVLDSTDSAGPATPVPPHDPRLLSAVKIAVAEAIASGKLGNNSTVGICSGEAPRIALRYLGREAKDRGWRISCVPSSQMSLAAIAQDSKTFGGALASASFMMSSEIDVAFCEVSAVDSDLTVIPSSADSEGCITTERLLLASSSYVVAVTKPGRTRRSLSVRGSEIVADVLPLGLAHVKASIFKTIPVAKIALRLQRGSSLPQVTDTGNVELALDAGQMLDAFGGDALGVIRGLRAIPGIVDVGLFSGLVSTVVRCDTNEILRSEASKQSRASAARSDILKGRFSLH